MLLHPDVQKKAQREIDNLGSTLPSLNDRNNLPYVDALCKEVLRWHATVPLGFPHMLKEDDIIGEYFVPKGTIVLGNAWWVDTCISIQIYLIQNFIEGPSYTRSLYMEMMLRHSTPKDFQNQMSVIQMPHLVSAEG